MIACVLSTAEGFSSAVKLRNSIILCPIVSSIIIGHHIADIQYPRSVFSLTNIIMITIVCTYTYSIVYTYFGDDNLFVLRVVDPLGSGQKDPDFFFILESRVGNF